MKTYPSKTRIIHNQYTQTQYNEIEYETKPSSAPQMDQEHEEPPASGP